MPVYMRFRNIQLLWFSFFIDFENVRRHFKLSRGECHSGNFIHFGAVSYKNLFAIGV